MKDEELDRMMRRVLLDAAAREEEGEAPFAPSRRHLAQMKAMKRNPLKWVQNRNRPVWKQILPQTTAALISIIVGLGMLVQISPEFGAKRQPWLMGWYGPYKGLSFSEGDIPEEMPRYTFAFVPEGYRLAEETRTDILRSLVYENGAGDTITLEYIFLYQDNDTIMLPEEGDVAEVTVNGAKGLIFTFKDPERPCRLTWVDEQMNLQFFLEAPFGPEKLIELAQTVGKIAK